MIPAEKTCTKCGEAKPLAEFHARKRGAGGKSSQCKACAGAYLNAWREANPPTEEQREQRRQANREWYADHGPEWRRQNYAQNRQRRADYSREWARRNPEKVREMGRRWRLENPDQFRAMQAIQNYRRRESRKAMKGDADVREYVKVLRQDVCAYCGGPCEHIDHIVPHAEARVTTWDNLSASCGFCNRSKREDSLLVFLLRANAT